MPDLTAHSGWPAYPMTGFSQIYLESNRALDWDDAHAGPVTWSQGASHLMDQC